MKNLAYFLASVVGLLVVSCSNNTQKMAPKNMTPPLADAKEKYLEMHGDVRLDPYYWLNDREDEEVLDYLERENDYHGKNDSAYQRFPGRFVPRDEGAD